MKKKGGFGLVYQDVMRNENISIESKAIYGYLSSIAGVGGECYPSVETICKDLNIGKNRLSKHLSQLIALGVVERTREKNGNIYGRNVYKITHEVEVSKELKRIFEAVESRDLEVGAVESRDLEVGAVESRDLEGEATNNNNINNNNINNNRENNNRDTIDYQLIADMYNDTCVSYPRLTVLSEGRKKAIRARMKNYTVEDFKRLFEMAERSSFLKGGNDRDWSATFDWLIKDANMAKVLDGNYEDRKEGGNDEQEGTTDDTPRRSSSDRSIEALIGREGFEKFKSSDAYRKLYAGNV